MLVVAVVLPMIYSTNYYIQHGQTLINLVAVLGLNVVMGLTGQTNPSTTSPP